MRNVLPVDRPDRTVIVHTKSGDYVYLTEKVEYSSSLKRSVPKRTAIGKLNSDGKLIPNHNYFDIYGQSYDLCEPCEKSDFVTTGLHAVVDSMSDEMQLKQLLNEVFGEDGNRILDVAVYMMTMQNNAMQYFEDYGYSHTLFSESNFSDSTIGKLMDGLKVKDIDLFVKSWVKMHASKDIYISYDSTNMNCTAGNLDLVEYGHAKDNDELPQINVSLGYNQTDNIPLMYEIYPGSIIDNTECKKMVDRANYYGCEGVGFILDRGYFSMDNIRYFEKNGYDYILMAKGNAKFVQESIEECGAVLKSGSGNYIAEHEIYGMTLEKEMFESEKKQYVHVYYNGVQAEKEKIQFNNRLKKMDEMLEEKKEKKIQRKEDVKAYETYYKVKFDEKGYFLNYQRKESKIRESINKFGYFVIVTSKKMRAEEAINIYRDRDAVEKVFRMEKSYLGFETFRVHSTEKLESKVFISFVALIIRNELMHKMKKLYQTNRKEYTVPKVIQQLERMGLTKLSDGKYYQRYNLTNRQKKILGAVGLTEKEYREFTENVKGQMH